MSRHSQRSRLAGLAVLTIALAGAAIWLATRPSPQKLFERGLAAGPRDGATAERLLREATRASGGHFPDAEIALCQLLLERGAWDEAAVQFAAADKESCRTDLLLDFGRTALAAGREREGIASLEAVRRRGNRDSGSALELLIEIARMWGATDEVISCARDWTELEPDNPRPWIVLIQTLKNEDRRDAECLDAVRQA
ncbi:MAG: hypothetical protein HY290_13735, partial [Planctomycetia bacterium]|nr:hypothetical protein [Planctomycetia bacterium]